MYNMQNTVHYESKLIFYLFIALFLTILSLMYIFLSLFSCLMLLTATLEPILTAKLLKQVYPYLKLCKHFLNSNTDTES